MKDINKKILSQNKFNLDDLLENRSLSGDKPQTDSYNKYADSGNVRNLCFVWPDGNMKFLNYAYLVSADYIIDDSKIILSFTSDTIVIKGSGLKDLYLELASHLPKQIVCIDPRYISVQDSNMTIITEIEVLKSNL